MGAFKHHRRSQIGQQGLPPTRGANAPPISWFEAGKSPLGSRRDEVVSDRTLELKKLSRHAGTNQV